MTEVPYEYIFFCMFNSLKKYGNKDNVSKEQVEKYVSKFLDLSKEIAQDVGKSNVVFNEYDVEEELDCFVRDHSDYFYKSNGKYYISDDIDYPDIEDEVMSFIFEKRIDDIFKVTNENIELLKTIGATYVYDEFTKMLKFELKLEQTYTEYVINPTPENLKKLQKQYFMRQLYVENLKGLPSYYMDALYLISTEFIDKFEYIYPEYPIDKDLWNSIPHLNGLESDEVVYDTPQVAIFGDEPLGFKKLEKDVDKMFESKSEDPLGIMNILFASSSIDDKIKEVVYLKYLGNLDSYIKKNGNDKNLLKVKARLMYILDNPDLCLFKEENFDKAISRLEAARFSMPEVYKLADESRFLTGDIFIGKNRKNVVEKLLLMKTYYDLTHDEDFKKLFDTFYTMPNYTEYRGVVFGRNKTLKRDPNA